MNYVQWENYRNQLKEECNALKIVINMMKPETIIENYDLEQMNYSNEQLYYIKNDRQNLLKTIIKEESKKGGDTIAR